MSAEVALNPLVWLLWLLDFIVWLLYFLLLGWVIALCNACTKSSAGKKTDNGTWRQSYVTDADWLPTELCKKPCGTVAKTAWDCFSTSFETFSESQCLGTRTFIGNHIADPNEKPSGKNPLRKIYGDTEWRTYEQVKHRAMAFGSGLRALDMVPSEARGKEQFEASSAPDTLLLWENTCADWMTGLAGAFSQSMVVATSYATLGAEGMLGSIDECDCKVLVCNRAQVAKCIKALNAHERADKIKGHLTTIIYTDLDQATNATVDGKYQATGKYWKDELKIAKDLTLAPEPMPKLELADGPEGIAIISFEEIIKIGQQKLLPPTPPEPDSMAVVMYTSGSTGKPKGACHMFGQPVTTQTELQYRCLHRTQKPLRLHWQHASQLLLLGQAGRRGSSFSLHSSTPPSALPGLPDVGGLRTHDQIHPLSGLPGIPASGTYPRTSG